MLWKEALSLMNLLLWLILSYSEGWSLQVPSLLDKGWNLSAMIFLLRISCHHKLWRAGWSSISCHYDLLLNLKAISAAKTLSHWSALLT